MISSALDGGEAPKDSGHHFVMILEGIVVVPRWSETCSSIIVIVILLFGLELLSQAKAVLHLVLVEGAWAFEDFLVLLIVVMLGVRFINGGNDVVWSATVILTSFGPFRSITTTVMMVATVVVAVVSVASFIRALITAVSWAVSAHILIEVNFSLFSVGVLIGSRDHLANPLWRLAIEFGAEVTVMESSDNGGDDLCFCDVGNRIPHLGKASDVAMVELGLLVDAIEIMLKYMYPYNCR